MKFSKTNHLRPLVFSQYRIEVSRNLWRETLRERVGLDDLKGILADMMSDSCWTPQMNGLLDFSEAQLDLSANEILRLALIMRHDERRSRGWLAFVVPNSMTYGIVRMLGYWSRNCDRMRIFANLADAEQWLDRNKDQVPPACREIDGIQSSQIRRSKM